MPSSDDDFEVVDAKGPNLRPSRSTARKAPRGKLPAIPRRPLVTIPGDATPASTSEASGSDVPLAIATTRTRPKRKRSSSAQSSTPEEYDELDEASKRRYKKPAVKKSSAEGASPTKGKAKADKKEAKPKKVSKAAIKRAKLEEIRNDRHFGKLEEAAIVRIANVQLDRMYLIHRFRRNQQLREEFDIFGSTGNVYKVVVARQVECTCMDFKIRRQVCKHLLFVYIKVLQLGGHLPIYSSLRNLSNDVLEQIFEEARPNPVAEVHAAKGIRQAWETSVGYEPSASNSSQDRTVESPEGKRIIPGEGDVCGVCYEDLEPGSTEGLEFCLKSCGRPIHTDCLETWFNSRGFDRTCIWCRARWHESTTSASKDPREDGYGIGVGRRGWVVDRATGRLLNLADAAVEEDPQPEQGVAADAADAADGWEDPPAEAVAAPPAATAAPVDEAPSEADERVGAAPAVEEAAAVPVEGAADATGWDDNAAVEEAPRAESGVAPAAAAAVEEAPVEANGGVVDEAAAPAGEEEADTSGWD